VKADVADEGLIKIMRSLAYNYITIHGDVYNETLGAKINDLADYELMTRIMTYGAEAETLVIMVMPLALGVRNEIIVLEDHAEAHRFIRGGEYGTQGFLICLLLKVEHYDILYST